LVKDVIEDLKAWARETAPTLTDEEWCETRHTVTMAEAHGRKSITDGYLRSRALLAYRDEVAAGLGKHEVKILLRRRETHWLFPPNDVARGLYEKALVCYWANDEHQAWTGDVTPFGRAVARALEAKHG
jgi:hypothetical protein